MTIAECRTILSAESADLTDAEIEAIIVDTTRAVDELYTSMKAAKAADAEGVRWTTHAFLTGETE